MKTMQFALALAAAFGLLQSAAYAQIKTDAEAEIPFAFTIGKTTLPAGKYIVQSMDEGQIQVRNETTQATVAHTVQSVQAKTAPETSELVFRRYGSREFLYRIFVEGSTDGLELAPSKLEKDLMGQGQAAVIHSHPLTRHKKSQAGKGATAHKPKS